MPALNHFELELNSGENSGVQMFYMEKGSPEYAGEASEKSVVRRIKLYVGEDAVWTPSEELRELWRKKVGENGEVKVTEYF